MRQILIVAAALLVGGGYAARYADHAISGNQPAQAASVQRVDEPRPPVHSGRTLTLNADRLGHFRTEGRIDGRFVEFVVDTGASLIALRASDAARAGIWPRPDDYTAVVSTANGKIKGAPAKLGRVEVGGITVYDVPALVLPDDALEVNLLGDAFLSRLRRYEYAGGRLVLEQ